MSTRSASNSGFQPFVPPYSGTSISNMTQTQQIELILSHLSGATNSLNRTQVQLSSLALRYEYIVESIERNQKQVKEDLVGVEKELESIYNRLHSLEKFVWKFTGAIIVIVSGGR